MELEADDEIDTDEADEDESMDLDMPSPKGRKRERTATSEPVGLPNFLFYPILIGVFYIFSRAKEPDIN